MNEAYRKAVLNNRPSKAWCGGVCGVRRLTLSYSCVYMVIIKMMAACEQPIGASSRKLVK